MDCSKLGCIKSVFANGLCHSHYDEERKQNLPLCSHDGCDVPSHAKGLCNKHYRQILQKTKPLCSIDGCGRHQQTSGLCNSHYRRKLRHGSSDITRPSDWGAKGKHPLYYSWGQVKKKRGYAEVDSRWDDFWLFVEDVGEKPSPTYKLQRLDDSKPYNKDNYAWTDRKIKFENGADYIKKYRDIHPEKFAKYEIKKKYGLADDEYQKMFNDQNSVCAICKNSETRIGTNNAVMNLAVDHCHKTGKIRGLLCANCNTSLGGFKDDINLLQSAIRYLEANKGLTTIY